jgi:hypothetical protein
METAIWDAAKTMTSEEREKLKLMTMKPPFFARQLLAKYTADLMEMKMNGVSENDLNYQMMERRANRILLQILVDQL